MKKALRACAMCFSRFCAIPSPFKVWDEEARPLMTLFLPAVGLLIGLLWTGLAWLLGILEAPALVTGAILCAWPMLASGFMHMDGFLDVTDAIRSWRDVEERRRILKDPHSGSFAVICCVVLVMLQFALLSSLREDADLWALTLIPISTRACAAACVTGLRPMSESQYAGAYLQGVKKSHLVIPIVTWVVTAAAGFVFLGWYGFVTVAAAAGYLLALQKSFRWLDGMSGDVSGHALVIGELCGVAVFALI